MRRRLVGSLLPQRVLGGRPIFGGRPSTSTPGRISFSARQCSAGSEKTSGSGGSWWKGTFGAGFGAFGAVFGATALEKFVADETEEVVRDLCHDFAEDWLSEEISGAVEFVASKEGMSADAMIKRIEIRKRNLAAAMRFLEKQQGASKGLMDMLGVDGRGFVVSRVPHKQDRYLAAGRECFWRDMGPESISEYDVTTGKRTDEADGPMPHEGVASMATALFTHHPDIRVVMHVPGGRPSVVLSAVVKPGDHAPLLPISDPARIFAAGGIRVLESKSRMQGLAFSDHFCKKVQKVFGEDKPPFCILIRNGGGYIMTGKTVHECWYRCRMFEAACDIQVMAVAADGKNGVLKSSMSTKHWGILGKQAEKAVSVDMPGWMLSSGKREWHQKLLDLKKDEGVEWIG